MHRSLLAATATALAALSLTACTSQTQKCSGGVCDIDVSGVGSTVELGGEGGSTLELVSATGTTADVKLDGQPVTLSVGVAIKLDNASLILRKVEGENDVQLQVTAGGGTETTP